MNSMSDKYNQLPDVNLSYQKSENSTSGKLNVTVNGREFAVLDAIASKHGSIITRVGSQIGKMIFPNKDEFKFHQKYIPIKTSENHIVYVKTKDLISAMRLKPSVIDNLLNRQRHEFVGISGEMGAVILGDKEILHELGKAERSQQADAVTMWLNVTLYNERAYEDVRADMYLMLDAEIPKDVKDSVTVSNTLKHEALNGLVTDKNLVQNRLKMSKTMVGRAGDETSRGIAVGNWNKVDNMVREKALSKGSLSVTDIQEINRELSAGLKNNEGTPGELRVMGENVSAGPTSKYVQGEHVAFEMKNFENWLAAELQKVDVGKESAIVVAARAGQRLVSIHPFSDGNGRTAQFVMDFILQRSGILPGSYKPKNLGILPAQTKNVTPQQAVIWVKESVEKSYAALSLPSPFAATA